jgi:hypothetical protein
MTGFATADALAPAGTSSPAFHGTELYEGLDFANRCEREGHAFLVDDGKSLTVSFGPPPEDPVDGIGVDCPFGTSAAFMSLLSGVLPNEAVGGDFQSRSTEIWVRDEIAKKYQTCRLWDAAARREFDRNYFHPTTHVQPAVAMRIVPNCLAWLIRQVGSGVEPAAFLIRARRGEGRIVEAHPRLFLYSMIERIHGLEPSKVSSAVLNSVASYKDKGKVSQSARREEVYGFLRDHTTWGGKHTRVLEPELPNELLLSDHAFDAWLAALTAWAHRRGECITWNEANISKEAVDIEGHILILRQAGRT